MRPPSGCTASTSAALPPSAAGARHRSDYSCPCLCRNTAKGYPVLRPGSPPFGAEYSAEEFRHKGYVAVEADIGRQRLGL